MPVQVTRGEGVIRDSMEHPEAVFQSVCTAAVVDGFTTDKAMSQAMRTVAPALLYGAGE